MTPDRFVAELHDMAPLHIAEIPTLIARQASGTLSRAATIREEIQATPVTVFEYSIGGDSVNAIVWSPTDRRFYDILDCC
jgi:hypothetical protein